MSLESKLTEVCALLTEKLQLCPNRLVFSQSVNKKDEVVSLFIQIFECSYPTSSTNEGTTTPVLRITGKKTTELFSTSRALADAMCIFCKEKDIETKIITDKRGVFQSVRFTLADVNDVYFEFVEKCAVFAVENYVSSADKFGCCARYVECSNAKKCLHSNLLYATACEYRQNLEQGRIFYGENRNV